MAWKLEKRRGSEEETRSQNMCFIFHELWRSNARFFGKLAYVHAIFRWCVTSIGRQSKYCNILLIVNFYTRYIGKCIVVFEKVSTDQTYQLHLLKRSVCKPFIFLTLICLVKFSTQTTIKNVSPVLESNHLISTFTFIQSSPIQFDTLKYNFRAINIWNYLRT